MKPEAFTKELKQALGTALQGVVLYGSAATEDYIAGKSDYNLLLIANAWGTRELDTIRPMTNKWVAAGNPAPLCFTPQRLGNSTDVFPMEMLDILENHRVLLGDAPLEGLTVSKEHLRHQVEFELRSKLLRLRQAYLQILKPEKNIGALIDDSLSPFLAVLKGALRLLSDQIPNHKLGVIQQLGEALQIDLSVFSNLLTQKKENLLRQKASKETFEQYLHAIETVLDRIDTQLK